MINFIKCFVGKYLFIHINIGLGGCYLKKTIHSFSPHTTTSGIFDEDKY